MNIWSMEEIRTLRYLVAQGLPLEEIAIALGRSQCAVRNKAGIHGISLKRAHSADLVKGPVFLAPDLHP